MADEPNTASSHECDDGMSPEVCLSIQDAGDLGTYIRQMERSKAQVRACPLIKEEP